MFDFRDATGQAAEEVSKLTGKPAVAVFSAQKGWCVVAADRGAHRTVQLDVGENKPLNVEVLDPNTFFG